MRRHLALAVACGIAVAGLATAAQAAGSTVDSTSDSTVVRTDQGPVRGTVTTDYRQFQGIPYAAPPVGRLRWVSPRPAARWTAPRDATQPGSPCAQVGGFPGDAPSDTEDCLYLNVTTPRHGADQKLAGRKLPVMLWIHGDGFFQSSGGIYGAERLAVQGDVVVVTFNYRLGAFGFLAHPSLPGSGNFGLEDQQAAMRWVHRNAAAFGGDPGNVTIFGESAGGVSVCAHLAAPGSAGLFQRAIIQSGPCALTTQWPYLDGVWTARPRAVAERAGEAVAAKLGCADAACLRGKSVAELLAASEGGQGFGPVVGGGVLPASPVDALATGRVNKVPVMQGTTRDEHRAFQAALDQFAGQPATPADYRSQLAAVFGEEQAATVMARYPLGDYDSASAALADIWTDYSWACTALSTDRLLAGTVPTYAYEFADEQAPWFAGASAPTFPTGAYHAAELQYLFSRAYGSGQLSPAQQRLSDQMIDYWTRFAHTGDPGWPRFSPSGGYVQSLAPGDGGIRPVDLGREHQCGFWRSLDG